MYSIFWKALFSGLFFMFLWINIAFTFNVLSIMNPTNVLSHPEEYYFGVSSFIEQFKTYFADNSMLAGFQEFLSRFGELIANYYRTYVVTLRMIGGTNSAWEIISAIIAILIFINNLIPMILMILMGLFYIIFLLVFAFEIALFIVAFFGGAFATRLPSTDWWEYENTINSAIMVCPTIL